MWLIHCPVRPVDVSSGRLFPQPLQGDIDKQLEIVLSPQETQHRERYDAGNTPSYWDRV